ncbi:hypothetical protein BHYA_0045g00100 [Botrytis hyacinthi]|uniref:Uncharacterized protein n=1 Tax=Botrytis hyacinthi TaxID=278943 RepID=A0A4Z1GSR0_9HELO|nr:hypothetical protein BHYA_0045g00100 [Botrytis hyacinthi]
MSSPEKSIETLAAKVNQLGGLYGFETVKYFTSPPNEDVFLHFSNQESSDCGVTAHMGLKDGCFGIRGCPVFKNRVDLLGRRESKADLFSQVIKWFQSKAKIQSSKSQNQRFAEEYETFINDEAKIRVYTTSQNRVGAVASGTKSDSTNSSDIAQPDITKNNDGRGIKRARDEDTDMPNGDVEVPRNLSKQGRKRAARRANVIAVVADSQS